MIPYQSAIVDLYLQKRIDWEEYYRAPQRRPEADADGRASRRSRACSRRRRRSAASSSPSCAPAGHQAARLVGGEVVYPPHIQKAYDTLAQAGLVSFGVGDDLRRLRPAGLGRRT